MKAIARILAVIALTCASYSLRAQVVQGEVGSYPNATSLVGNERILADQSAIFPCTSCTVNLTPVQISAFLKGSGNLFPPYSIGYLFWNGTGFQWNSPSGLGTVTNVGLSMPIGFSVSPSSITTSGTFNVTTALSGVLKGSGGSFTTAAAGDVFGLWSGSCSSSTFLRGDGACAAPAGTVSTTGAPASGELTLFSGPMTITNGNISGDCTTSGGLSITCTKTGGTAFAASATIDATNASNLSSGTLVAGRLPAFSGDCTASSGTASLTCMKTNGVAFGTFATANAATPPAIGGTTPNSANFTQVTATGSAGQYAALFFGSATSGQSDGVAIEAGTTSADTAFYVRNPSVNTAYFRVYGDGGTVVGNPTGGDEGLGTVNAAGYYANGVLVGTVGTTGSPSSGELATFTGATSISNGNLSGDCTTSNSLAITCTKTGGAVFGTFATANAASPPAIGSSTPAGGAFTTLSSSGATTLGGTTVSSLTDSGVTGANQCLQINTSGQVTGSGSGCNIVGTALEIVEPSNQTRASSTSFTCDTNLTLALAANAVYQVDAIASVSAGAGGFYTGFSYSGTAASPSGFWTATYGAAGAFTGGSFPTPFSTNTGYQVCTSTCSSGYAHMSGVMSTSTAGSLCIAWSQETSNAANSTMLAGSSLTAIRLH